MAKKQERRHIYGEVNAPQDVHKINQQLRREMDDVSSREQLTELKKRSDYLCTLAEAPSWKEKFGDRIDEVQRVAQAEDRETTSYANEIARRHGWESDYDAWGGG